MSKLRYQSLNKLKISNWGRIYNKLKISNWGRIYDERFLVWLSRASAETKSKTKFIFTIFAPVRYVQESKLAQSILKSQLRPIFDLEERDGITQIELDSGLTSDAVTFARMAIANHAQNKSHKEYLRAIKNLDDLDQNSAVFKLATSPEMLKSVTKYFGVLPILYDVSVLHSPAASSTAHTSHYEGSQLFHRDGEDFKNLKIWVLASDVKLENGPTQVLPASMSKEIAKKLKYKMGTKIPNDNPFREVESKLIPATGTAGTTYATDTVTCFHYGSRTGVSSERLVIMFHYVTSYSGYFRSGLRRKGSETDINLPREKAITLPKFDREKLTLEARILLRPYLNTH